MGTRKTFSPLGVTSTKDKINLYIKSVKNNNYELEMLQSKDAISFNKTDKTIQIKNKINQTINPGRINFLKISEMDKNFFGTINLENSNFIIKHEKEGIWKIINKIPKVKKEIILISGYLYKDFNVFFWHDETIHIGVSKDFINWKIYHDPIFDPHLQDNQELILLNSFVNNNSIFLIYALATKIESTIYFNLSLAIFKKDDPQKIAWRMPCEFWSLPENLLNKIVSPIGVILFKEKTYSFWQTKNQNIISIEHSLLHEIIDNKPKELVKKALNNPIIKPRKNKNWESQAVFNPAALKGDNKIHLLYRAVGNDWISRLGYAESLDGVHITTRSEDPAYLPREPFEGVFTSQNSSYVSGPGFGGCEDPRLTKIDDKVYLTYVAYNGITYPRVALSSISYRDFKNQKWNWEKPVLISKPGIIDKNAVIFPEKIKNKYVILHRVFPNILIDFLDNLNFDEDNFLSGSHMILPRKIGWDSRKIGAGAPPIKTSYGWLLIYHAVDDKNDKKYQIGAMILDINDPTKVLYRTDQPIITPSLWYENEGYKSGVVYPCGAVVLNNILHIYYGGADTYVCVATADINEFLFNLINRNKILFNKTNIINL